MSLINWVKEHMAATILILLAIYFVYTTIVNTFFGVELLNVSTPQVEKGYSRTADSAGITADLAPNSYREEYAPQPDVDERLVIQESNISLLVNDVSSAQDRILNYAKENGGYMVSTGLSNPQDAPTSNITIRVPAEKLDSTLDFLESLSVKVVSENLRGKDVTDQYVDIEERLQTLENTKARFESILEQAEEIQDITNVTQQIINYQRQIDNLKGRQQALEQNAEMAKLTIYLSTDELALPYAPSETWRPRVIFKYAVRSLISTLRGVGSLLIWIAVYSVIWVPVLVVYFVVRRYKRNNKPDKDPQQS